MADMKFVADFSDIQTMRRELVGVSKDAKKSASVFETAYNKAERQLQKTAKANQQFYNDTLKIDRATKSASQSADVFTREIRKQEKATKAYNTENQRLINKLNPLRAASQLYEKELNDINVAMDRGVINDRQRQQSLDALNNEFNQFATQGKAANAMNNRFAASTNMAGRRTNQLGVLMQQSGYQVGDFAVQVQSGTNVMVALGQQATQLVGTFGMLAKSTKMIGVFAGLGVLIPIATAVAGSLLRMGQNAKEAEADISDVTSALSDYQNQVEIAGRSTQSLTEEFGELAGEVRALSEFFQEVAVSRALDALKTGTATFSAGLEDAAERASLLNSEMERLGNPKKGEDRFALVATIKSRAEDAAKALGLTTDQSIRLQDTLSSIDESQSLVSLRDNTLTALQTIEGMTFESGKIPPEISKIVEKLKEVLGASTRATSEMDNTANSASNIADGLERAVSAMSSLSGFTAGLDRALSVSLAKVEALKAGTDAAIAGRITGLRLDLKEKVGAARKSGASSLMTTAENFTGQATIAQIEAADTRAKALQQSQRGGSGGSSGGGGGSGTQQDPRAFLKSLERELDLKRLLVGVNDETAERLKLEARLKEKLLETGGKVTEADRKRIEALVKQSEAIRQAEAAEERRRANIERFEQQMSDSITNIVTEAKTIEDAFIGVIRNIVAELFKQNVADPIAGGIGDFVGGLFGGGGGGPLAGNKLFDIAGSFAKGGAFTNGVVDKPTMFPMGQMGEAGPEAIMPLSRGKNGKLGVMAEGGSGGNPVTVNNHFHIAANGDESVKKIIQQEAPKISAMTEKQIINSRRRGGSLKQAFG